MVTSMCVCVHAYVSALLLLPRPCLPPLPLVVKMFECVCVCVCTVRLHMCICKCMPRVCVFKASAAASLPPLCECV